MIALAFGLALLVFFTLLGAGPSVSMLGPRWRPLWPLVAPVVGFALVAVAGDAPSWRWSVAAYAWPLTALLAATSVALLYRHRRALHAHELRLFALPVLLLPWALAPYLSLHSLTTLSEHNHDWTYYLNLETALRRAGYGASWTDTGDLFVDMSAVLRRGGWRAGLSVVGAAVGTIFRLAPHQVDGTLWGVLDVVFVGATVAAHRIMVPVASMRARAFVVVAAAASGPALLLLRMSFASHLAAMPLMVLSTAVSFRALTSRTQTLPALGALLLAATITVLADATPYLAAMGLALVAASLWARRIPLARLGPRAAWGLVAPALVPVALYRIVLSIRSLEVTGYRPPGARFDTGVGTLLTSALGDSLHEVPWAEEPSSLLGLVVAASVTGTVLVGAAAFVRARTSRAMLFAPLLVGLALALACDLLGLGYPTWKIALTTSPFVTIAIAAGLDRLPKRGLAAGTLVLAVQCGTAGWALARAPEPIGILPVHEALVARLAHQPGRVYLMGHQGRPLGVAHEHALGYLLAQHDRTLHAIPDPSSYYRISWPAQDLAIPVGEAPLVVVTPDLDGVLNGGRERFRIGPFHVLSPEPGARPSNLSYDEGFLAREVEPGRVFRWADERATLTVDLPAEDACLVAEIRGTPDGDATAVQVLVRPFARDTWAPVADEVIGERVVPIGVDWSLQTLARASGPAQAVQVTIVYLGRRRGELVDARPIHFALGNVGVRRGAACP